MATAINRTLYIGLGGTGAQTLAKIKSHFVGSYGEVPPMISFLAIDTDQKRPTPPWPRLLTEETSASKPTSCA